VKNRDAKIFRLISIEVLRNALVFRNLLFGRILKTHEECLLDQCVNIDLVPASRTSIGRLDHSMCDVRFPTHEYLTLLCLSLFFFLDSGKRSPDRNIFFVLLLLQSRLDNQPSNRSRWTFYMNK
jgi:hypothetical protein